MAIQNFLSGGYYGKLGATVGQRWKNKRTIRTYVIPRNPRTEIQQANRGKFADAVTFSQAAMQMNYYTNIFANETMSQWNYRMKTARQLKDAGQVYLDLIPLYPISFTPPTLLTSISVEEKQGQRHVTFSAPDLQDTSDRVLSMMFAFFNSSQIFIGYKLYIGYYYADNPGYIECDLDNNEEIDEYTKVRVVSNDDIDSNTDMISSPALIINSSSYVERAFNTAISNVEINTNGIEITFLEPFKTFTTCVGNISAYVVKQGAYSTLSNNSVTLFKKNGFFAARIEDVCIYDYERSAFNSDGYIRIQDLVVEGANFKYTTDDTTVNYSETNPVRSLANAFTQLEALNSNIRVQMNIFTDVGASIANAKLNCDGRLTDTTEINVSLVRSEFADTSTTFYISGEYAKYPMSASSYIKIPTTSFTVKGVTYSLENEITLTGSNGNTTSPYLITLGWQGYRDGLTDEDTPLASLEMHFNLSFILENEPYESDLENMALQVIENTIVKDTSRSYEWQLNTDGTKSELVIIFYYGEEFATTDTSTLTVSLSGTKNIEIEGITYTMPAMQNLSLDSFFE